MRIHRLFGLLLAGLILLVAGCSGDDRVVSPPDNGGAAGVSAAIDPQLVAQAIVMASGWEVADDTESPGKAAVALDPGQSFRLLGSSRTVVTGDIAHYAWQVRVGSGPHDIIGLHRVVRETSPCRPLRTRLNVFLQHGDGVGFVKFLFGAAAPSVPDDQAFAVYLARNGVDVWGIDQGWVLVPEGTADFSFMADWGMQRAVKDLGIGLAVARASRLLTGSGAGKMNLLGYSSGVFTGYAYLNAETQLPPLLRNVCGYLPVDCPYKDDDETNLAGAQATALFYESLLDSGTYVDLNAGGLFLALGQLGRDDPDGASPIWPGVTNLQAALYVCSATYLLAPFPPAWHYMGGEFDESGAPTGLQYTTVDGMLDFLNLAAPYEAVRFEYDVYCIWGGGKDVPWDDHIQEISVPLLYVGAAGGLGKAGLYMTTLVGSADVSSVIAQLHPDSEVALDFGHIDIFAARNAEAQVWNPILGWLVGHSALRVGLAMES